MTGNSRQNILDRIKKNRPSRSKEADLTTFFPADKTDLVLKFRDNLKRNKGHYMELDSPGELGDLLNEQIDGTSFIDFTNTVQGSEEIWKTDDLQNFNSIKVFIAQGSLGVAENGAIWINDEDLKYKRILPFIVEKSIFLLKKDLIVASMHDAYQKLGKFSTGFGVFIAGPSKTGDIEQNLVIGAHGPLYHSVILI
ncbi:MAG: LUD domain-containing protein [Cyclobacteriaceae bacterium]